MWFSLNGAALGGPAKFGLAAAFAKLRDRTCRSARPWLGPAGERPANAFSRFSGLVGKAAMKTRAACNGSVPGKAGWDRELLAIELQGLVDLDFEIELTGFSLAEVDIVLDEARESAPDGADASIEDNIPPYRHEGPAVTQPGDLWILGRHKLICGDARETAAYGALLGDEAVDLICTDPPYNVPIDGHVCGSGRIRHRNFAMGVGEMDKDQFTRFLVGTLGPAAARCRDGAIAYVFMDWRHMGELLNAGEQVFSELKNLCVWNKTNGGMGTFYRSKHELIFVFKVGIAPHVNTFGLGETGRYRTNVWEYAGVNTFREGRLDDLELHPTVKPVDLVADAIKDCSRRGAIILDPFGGSGTTMIAAQKSGRLARLVEYDPAYCDVILRRFEAVTGTSAILARTGQSLDVTAACTQPETSHDLDQGRSSTIQSAEEVQ
jgi:DNA modification methylase